MKTGEAWAIIDERNKERREYVEGLEVALREIGTISSSSNREVLRLADIARRALAKGKNAWWNKGG